MQTGYTPHSGTPQAPGAGTTGAAGPQAAASHTAQSANGAAPADPFAAALSRQSTSYDTGAFALSGEPGIDRMIRLEQALKRFGSPF